MNIADIGIRLKVLRIEARLSQQEVARRAGVGVRSVSTWETNRRLPDVQQLNAVCAALGTSMSKFCRSLEVEPLSSFETSPQERRVIELLREQDPERRLWILGRWEEEAAEVSVS